MPLDPTPLDTPADEPADKPLDPLPTDELVEIQLRYCDVRRRSDIWERFKVKRNVEDVSLLGRIVADIAKKHRRLGHYPTKFASWVGESAAFWQRFGTGDASAKAKIYLAKNVPRILRMLLLGDAQEGPSDSGLVADAVIDLLTQYDERRGFTFCDPEYRTCNYPMSLREELAEVRVMRRKVRQLGEGTREQIVVVSGRAPFYHADKQQTERSVQQELVDALSDGVRITLVYPKSPSTEAGERAAQIERIARERAAGLLTGDDPLLRLLPVNPGEVCPDGRYYGELFSPLFRFTLYRSDRAGDREGDYNPSDMVSVVRTHDTSSGYFKYLSYNDDERKTLVSWFASCIR